MLDPGWIRRRNSGNFASAAWGVVGPLLAFDAATINDTSSAGVVATAVAYSIGVPTLTASAATTYTAAATVYIGGDPTASTNVTITKGYGLWNVGKTRFDDNLEFSATGKGASFHGGGTITGASGAVTVTPATTSAFNVNGASNTALMNLNPAAAGNASKLRFTQPATYYSWQISGQDFADNTLAVYPSTTGGGSTFSTPVFYFGLTASVFTGLNKLQFGATSAATIGSSADTTAGNLTLTAPSASTTILLTGAGGGSYFESRVYNAGSTLTAMSVQRAGGTASSWGVGLPAGSTSLTFNNGTDRLTVDASGNTTTGGSVTTSAPTTGTAAAWKMGVAVVSGVSVLLTDRYIQLDVAGTLYKVALVSNS